MFYQQHHLDLMSVVSDSGQPHEFVYFNQKKWMVAFSEKYHQIILETPIPSPKFTGIEQKQI